MLSQSITVTVTICVCVQRQQTYKFISLQKDKNGPQTHLTANLKARFAELLIILPVFGIPRIQESGKSVRALGDTELEEATHGLNEREPINLA